MKKYIYLIALLILAVGCKQKNQPQSIMGNKNKPAWTTISEYDMSNTMTMIVRVDLSKSYPEQYNAYIATQDDGLGISSNDLLAAFAGETCIGCKSLNEDGLFYLSVVQPMNDPMGNFKLIYYSEKFRNIFVSTDSYTFVTDGMIGTPDKPLEPTFVVNE